MTSSYSSIRNKKAYRRVAVLLAACCAVFSWSVYVFGGEPKLSAQEIINRMVVHADDYWDLTRGYTFLVDIMVEDYEGDGSLKKQVSVTERLYHYYGRRFFRLVKENGKPLMGEALKEENIRETKFRERTLEAFAKKDSSDLYGRMDTNAILIADLAERYTYDVVGTDTLEGRDVYVINFVPKPGLKAQTRRDKIFNELGGTAWIDTEQFYIVKAVGRLIDNVRVGWIAANITDVEINYEQQEVSVGVWMPRYVDATVTGKIFFFKKINRYTSAHFYEYMKTDEAPPGFFEFTEDPAGDSSE